MVRISLKEPVCGIMSTDNAVGAQTGRPGAARPVRDLLGGYHLTGRLDFNSRGNLIPSV
jgi:hypothetical protein